MSIKEVQRHSDYMNAMGDYEFLADAMKGEGAIKDKGEAYLPKTSGMLQQELLKSSGQLPASGIAGESRYEAYKRRAEFPEKVGIACDTASGLITEKQAVFDAPDAWSSIADVATPEGDTIHDLHRIVSDRLCEKGRCGIWADVNSAGLPFWVVYTAEQITDWGYKLIGDAKMLTYLQLETVGDHDGEQVSKIRQIRLTKLGVVVQDYVKKKDGEEFVEIDTDQPSMAGAGDDTEQLKNGDKVGHRLPWIPFQFFGSDENKAKIGRAPFLPLARQCRKAYMLSATYMESLTLGEPTFWVAGLTKEWITDGFAPTTVGFGNLWKLPAGATAGVVEPKGPMISEQRLALNEAQARADELSLRPFETQSRMVESGDAKKERRKTQTSAIKVMAQNIGSGMQKIMRLSAVWLGLDPKLVIFRPDYDFIDIVMSPDDAVKLQAVKQGGGMSGRTLHENYQRGGLTEKPYEEEQELIGKGE